MGAGITLEESGGIDFELPTLDPDSAEINFSNDLIKKYNEHIEDLEIAIKDVFEGSELSKFTKNDFDKLKRNKDTQNSGDLMAL